MTKAIAQTLHTANIYRLHISYFLIGVCALLVFAYCINVYTVIAKSTDANTVLKQAQTLENSVKNLDSEYIKMTSNMTPNTLSSYGLSEGKVAAFITKTPATGIVALGGYEF